MKTPSDIQCRILAFEQLSLRDLYEILKLRSDIFVVEQNSVYHDLDRVDYDVHHLLLEKEGVLVGYARLIPPGRMYPEASIGRIIIHPDFRGFKLGKRIVQESMDFMKKAYPEARIRLNAQLYLKRFYESFGFMQDSDIYDDGGIEHISMVN